MREDHLMEGEREDEEEEGSGRTGSHGAKFGMNSFCLCFPGLSWKGEPEEDRPPSRKRGKQQKKPHVFLDSSISFECLGYATPHPENMLEETTCVARPRLWNVEIRI